MGDSQSGVQSIDSMPSLLGKTMAGAELAGAHFIGVGQHLERFPLLID